MEGEEAMEVDGAAPAAAPDAVPISTPAAAPIAAPAATPAAQILPCGFCERTFYHKNGRQLHQQSSHRSPGWCRVCKRRFTNESEFELHKDAANCRRGKLVRGKGGKR